MSRFTLSLALVLSLSSVASAKRMPESAFAQPPAAAEAFAPQEMPAQIVPAVLDRAKVRAALAKARAKNLAAFRVYQQTGVFPSNTFSDKKLNVWVDAEGHYCAAATIIKASGQVDLVTRTGEQNNFIRLADVQQGPLMNWILMSGFTQDEIAAIQEPFRPVMREQPVEPILVDAKLRKAEDKRLVAKYRAVDKMLVKNQKKSLDLATAKLMSHPQLAWQLVAANS
ncbi:MAG: hypothetical protein HOV81_40865 [Kofleriaceae bacterium]|nr:hypothetical protein [Kofleriaceae bacterium]